MIEHKRMVNTNTKELERIVLSAAKDKDLFDELDDILKQMIKDTCGIADDMAMSFGLDLDSGRGRGR